MKELFLKVLQLSLSGSLVILAVMGLRLVLKKAPRRVFCLLWLLAGLRLMLPFEIESRFSLQPKLGAVVPELVQQMDVPPVSQPPYYEHSGDIRNTPEVTTEPQPAMEEPEFAETPQLMAAPAVNVDYTAVAAWLWAGGVAGLLTYSVLSYIRLRRRVGRAVILEEGIWICRNTDTAFVLGFFRPRIYLPTGLSGEERRLILDHEKVHIARLDHWSRAVGFVVLAVHWFNPLVWAAFTLLCRDMEMACDEAVVKSMTVQERKAYTAALLRCSARANRIGVCPVAFSEVSVKRRIINVLNYKKKGFWISLAAVIAVAVVAVCFLTSPVEVGPSGEPFATASEPGAWARGISVDAVSAARVYVRHSKSYTAEGHIVASSRYDYTAEQMEPLLAILNEIPEGVFGPVQQLDRGSFGFYETMLGSNKGVSVTIFDEVNGLAALLRLHNGGTVDLILTDELEKAKTDDLYVDDLRCWTIQSMELSEYLQGLLEQPPNEDDVTPTADSRGEAYLAQCHEALENWKKLDSYHLRVDRQFEGGAVLNDASSTEFWRDGDRVLRITTIETADSLDRNYYLTVGDTLYEREYGNSPLNYGEVDSGWYEGDTARSVLYSWVDTFDWEEHFIGYEGTETDADMQIVTISITENPVFSNANHYYTEIPYTVSFYFRADGSLAYLVQVTSEIHEYVQDGEPRREATQTTATYQLLSTSADEIAAAIDACYLDAAEQAGEA